MRRLGRLALIASLTVSGLLVCAAVVLWIALETPTVQAFIRDRMLALLRTSIGADVAIGHVEVGFDRSLVVHDLRLKVGGHAVARIPRLQIEYAPAALARGRVLLRRVVLTAPWVRAVRTPAGWRLPGPAGGDGTPGLPLEVEISRLEVTNGRLAIGILEAEPTRVALADINAELRVVATRDGVDVGVSRLSFVPRGVALSPVEAAGTMVKRADGALCLGDFRVVTRRSRLRSAGCVDLEKAVRADLAVEPLDAQEARAIFPTSPLRSSMTASIRAEGPWHETAVDVRLGFGMGGEVRGSGIVDLRRDRLAYRARVRFSGLDPGTVVDGGPPGRLSGRARVHGRGVGEDTAFGYRLVVNSSQLVAREIDALRVHGRYEKATHELRARIDAAAGHATLRGLLTGDPVPAYGIRSRVRLERLEALLPGVPGGARLRIAFRGTGAEPATAQAWLEGTIRDASIGGIKLTRGTLRAALEQGTLRLEEVSVDGPGLQVTVGGAVDVETRSSDLALHGRLDMGRVGAVQGMPAAGELRAEASLRGSLEALAMEAMVSGQQVAYASVSAEDVRLALRGRSRGPQGADGTAHFTATGLRVGSIPPREGELEVTWERAERVDGIRISASAQTDGGVTEQLALALTRSPGRTDGTLENLLVTLPSGVAWQLAEPGTFAVREEGFQTDGLTLAADQQRISVAGRAGFRGNNDAVLTLDHVDLGGVCTAAGLPQCAGLVKGRLELAGTPAAPRVDSVVSVSGVRVGSVDYGELNLAAQYSDRRATLDATARTSVSGTLDVEAALPIDLAWVGERHDLSQAPMRIAVRSDGLDLGFLRAMAPREVREVRGRATVDVRMTGTPAAFSTEGGMTLAGGSVELTATGVPYTEIRGSVTATGGRFQVSELHVQGGDGALETSGYVDLTADAIPRLSLALRLQDFLAIRSRLVEAVLNGDMQVRGSMTAPEILGDLDIGRMVLRPPRLASFSAPVQEPDPTIEVVGDEPETKESPPPPPGHVMDPVRLDLSLRLARNAWVRHKDANVELAGEFRVEKEPYGDLQVRGDIVLVRGWYAFQGRRFHVKEGRIKLAGADADPYIDVTGAYKARGYTILAHVHGFSSGPELVLSSDPVLEQADILSVLLFGKPASELTGGEAVGLQQQTVQLASQYVIGELEPSVRDTLGLDTLEVELPEEANGSGRVTVGRYVTRDVFVSLGQEFGSSVAQVFGVEYGLTPRISIRGSTSTEGQSAVDIFWHRRY